METSCYCLLLLFIPFLYSLINQIANKVRNLPPSPPLSLPIIGHLHLMNKPGIFAHLADKYGPILMLHFGSRSVLLATSPSAVEECLTKNDIVFAHRPEFLTGKYLGYNYTTLVWSSYGQHWRNLRKIAAVHILSSTRIQMFTKLRREEVHSMTRRLLRASEADASGVVEMKSTFFELTLNIMMRMVAGKRHYDDEAQKWRKPGSSGR